MVTFHCLRSGSWKPLVWIRRICFRTVDLPDSPAPVHRQRPVVIGVPALSCIPSSSSFTSFCILRWSSRSCFSISLLFFASGSSCLPFPKHMILAMAIHSRSTASRRGDNVYPGESQPVWPRVRCVESRLAVARSGRVCEPCCCDSCSRKCLRQRGCTARGGVEWRAEGGRRGAAACRRSSGRRRKGDGWDGCNAVVAMQVCCGWIAGQAPSSPGTRHRLIRRESAAEPKVRDRWGWAWLVTGRSLLL